MNRVRVKICGITRISDGLLAASAGADAIGLVFYSQSPRAVSIDNANQIIWGLPPFITRVGLFVNNSTAEIQSILSNVNLDMLQFHGDESPQMCEQFGKPWLKAIRMQAGINLPECIDKFDKSAGLLLDSYVPGNPGGTGHAFDWATVRPGLKKPVVLAGGLHADNVQQAIGMVRPYAVDVSSGVESAPGIKDSRKVADFINKVRETNCE